MARDIRFGRFFAVVAVAAVVAGLGAPATALTGDAAQDSADVTLTVTVVDGDGDPIQGAELSATWDGGGPVNETTRSNGKALFDVPEGADVTIRATHDEYALPSPVVVEGATEREVEIEMTPTATAEIAVEDADGPLSNAVVRLFRDGEVVANERTDAEGRYTTDRLAHGEYRLVAFKEGYLRTEETLEIDGDVSRTVTVESESVLLTVEAVANDSERPLANATVHVDGVGTVQTLGGGQARIGVPVNARLGVTVQKAGYQQATEDVRVGESDAELTVSLRPAQGLAIEASTLRAAVGETAAVTVTDEDGDPVAGANVTVDGERVGETDSEGRIDVPIETEGPNRVVAADGGETAEVSIEGVAESETDSPTETAADDGGSVLGPVVAVAVLLTLALGAAITLVRRRRDDGL